MFFGKSVKLPNLVLDGKPIEWVNSWSYLGVDLRSHKNFNCSIDNKVKAFYRCADAILRIDGRSDKMVMLHLLETQYVSVLTRLKSSTLLTETNVENSVAYNAIFGRVFGYRQWESVTNLQHSLKRHTWEELTKSRTEKLRQSISIHPLFA